MEWKSERPCEVYAHSSNSGHMLAGFVDQHVVILCPILHLYNELHPASIMVWGCFSWHGHRRLFFPPKRSTVYCKVYQEILQEKVPPCKQSHRLQFSNKIMLLAKPLKQCKHSSISQRSVFWNGQATVRTLTQWKTVYKHPKYIDDLKKAIKEVRVKETDQDVCRRLVMSMTT